MDVARMSTRRIVAALLAVGMLAAPGCLFSGKHKRVIRQNEPIRQISFESPAAQHAFQQYALDREQRKSTGSQTTLVIPFLLATSFSNELSQNAFYNDCVARVDSNGDGMISDLEVATLQGDLEIQESLEIVDETEQVQSPVIPVSNTSGRPVEYRATISDR